MLCINQGSLCCCMYLCIFSRKENVLIEISVQAANQGSCNSDVSALFPVSKSLGDVKSVFFMRWTLFPSRCTGIPSVLRTDASSLFPQMIDMPSETSMRVWFCPSTGNPSVVRLLYLTESTAVPVCPKLTACRPDAGYSTLFAAPI